MDYLYPQSYYDDQYDLATITLCLDYYHSLRKGMEAKRAELKDMTDEEFRKDTHKALSYTVNAIKIERFRQRAEFIQKWMERDRKVQETYNNAIPPTGVRCKECGSEMELSFKEFSHAYEKDATVLFMFDCINIKCHKGQLLYADGRLWQYTPLRCPKCNAALESTVKVKKDRVTSTYTCPSCSYSKKDILDFAKFRKEQKAKETQERKVLAEYRTEFCYNEKDGQEAVRSADTLVRVIKEIQEREKKEADPVFQKAMTLKKISIVEMEKLIVDAITPQKYIRFTLGQPIMGRFVEVPFTVQDIDGNRQQYDSRNQLKKLIVTALAGTNWRLMSDGITARLGVLSGRLKGMEQEDNLMEVIRK